MKYLFLGLIASLTLGLRADCPNWSHCPYDGATTYRAGCTTTETGHECKFTHSYYESVNGHLESRTHEHWIACD